MSNPPPHYAQVIRRHDPLLAWLFGALTGFMILGNAYEASLSGVTVNPERLGALPLLCFVLLFCLYCRSFGLPRYSAALLFLYSLWSLVASAICDVMQWSVKMWLLLSVAMSFYFIVNLFRFDPLQIFTSRTFRLLAWFFGPLLALVYVASLLNVQFPSFVKYWLQEGSGGLRIRGTMQEANLFGSIVTLFILMTLALMEKRKLLWWVLLAGLHAALVFSFSRLPWFAYIVALCVYYLLLLPYRLNVKNSTKVFLLLVAFFSITAVCVYLVFDQFGKYEIVGRVHSVTTRLIMWELAVQDIWEHPLVGNGMFSLSKLHPSAAMTVGSDTERSVWISNLFLAVLHDTGTIGLLIFCTFIVVVVARGVKTIRSAVLGGAVDPTMLRVAAALVATAISFVISGMSIPAHCLGFFWAVFALAERAAVEIGNRQRSAIFSPNPRISH